MLKVKDVRDELKRKYREGEFVIDKSGAKTVEILGATFVCDEDFIVRAPNAEYIERELEWYKSQSLYVADIQGKTPAIWESVSSHDGKINSNYGFLIWSKENGNQYDMVRQELGHNRNSRRATMIYNRPSIHTDFCTDGMSDFICTYANGFFVRDDKLYSHYIALS